MRRKIPSWTRSVSTELVDQRGRKAAAQVGRQALAAGTRQGAVDQGQQIIERVQAALALATRQLVDEITAQVGHQGEHPGVRRLVEAHLRIEKRAGRVEKGVARRLASLAGRPFERCRRELVEAFGKPRGRRVDHEQARGLQQPALHAAAPVLVAVERSAVQEQLPHRVVRVPPRAPRPEPRGIERRLERLRVPARAGVRPDHGQPRSRRTCSDPRGETVGTEPALDQRRGHRARDRVLHVDAPEVVADLAHEVVLAGEDGGIEMRAAFQRGLGQQALAESVNGVDGGLVEPGQGAVEPVARGAGVDAIRHRIAVQRIFHGPAPEFLAQGGKACADSCPPVRWSRPRCK
ncbi:MAG: hypothetical protein M5U09_05470 [Gammaproteobacteria bacterium]|nr:hypothetical protein [Gammaproteobacteria bacterium]